MSQTLTANKPTFTRSVQEVADIAASAEKAAYEETLKPTEDIKKSAVRTLTTETDAAVYVAGITNMKWVPIHNNMFADRRAWQLVDAFTNESPLKAGYTLVVEVVEAKFDGLSDVCERRFVEGNLTNVGFDVNIIVEASWWRKLTKKGGRQVYSSARELVGYLR